MSGKGGVYGVARSRRRFYADDEKDKLIDRIKYYIRNSELSPSKIAKTFGVSTSFVCKIKHGETNGKEENN